MNGGNTAERTVWLCGAWAIAFVVTPPLGICILAGAVGAFWYFKKPKSWDDGLFMFFALPKQTKVIIGVILGGVVGSFMGVVAMGDGISGMLPLAALMGYLVHVNTPENKP